VAVASTSPVIEIWDLDVIDSLKCKTKLGRRRNKKKKVTRIGHKDAVLSLSWNKQVKNVLASGSADHDVKLWDLSTGQDVKTLSHTDKVQTLTWHPYEKQTLLTGSSDKNARVFDCDSEDCKIYDIGQEVEIVTWNHFKPYNFLVGTDGGDVICHDARTSEPVWKISAHTSAVSGLSLSSECPGCLITVSEDKKVKIWDITSQPKFVVEKDFEMGKLFNCVFAPDAPFVVAMGGEKSDGLFKVWDIRNSAAANNKFKKKKLLTTQAEEMEDDT